MKRQISRRAFTLIELLLVMVILAVLAGVAVPIYFGYAKDSKIKATLATLANVKTQIHTYEVTKENIPSQQDGLQALVNAGLLEKFPVDPWGNPIQYKNPGQQNPAFDIYSWGPDGQDGTDDDIYPQ